MNKKVIIIVAIIICILVGVFLVKKINKKDNNDTPNKTIVTDEAIKEQDIIEFEKKLKNDGLELSQRKEIYSPDIDEYGYYYDLNGEEIEIYKLELDKLNDICVKVEDFEITIETLNFEIKEGICYNNYLILNCEKNKDKIIQALESENIYE